MQTTTHHTKKNVTIILIVAGLAVLLALPAQQAIAQTPVTNIENAAGDSVFVSFDDGALLGLGEEGTGVIPASGAGTRMMWYPAKAAFRAGYVGGTQWDDANVGGYSVAMGRNTTASSIYSVAMGDGSTASGTYSVAMGSGPTASGDKSVALGSLTNAIAQDAMAWGQRTTASGIGATAWGGGTTASGVAATTMGGGTIAATDFSLSIGEYNSANTSADNTLLVAGNGTSSTPSDALVLDKDAGLVVKGEYGTGNIPTTGAGTRMMWYPAKAAFRAGRVSGTEWDYANIGTYSVAMGRSNTASGFGSTAMGDGTTASGTYSMAMGDETTASGARSVAMGFYTTASGSYSAAMGRVTTAATDVSLSIGQYNSANTSADNTLFVAGNGTSSTPSDALVLDENGNLTISGTLSDASDRRLKKDIKSLDENILRKLETIQPVSYQFKNQQTHPAGPQIGLIAQEVQKQFPELVSKGSKGYLSVSYSKFTTVLLKGIQEQQAEIQSLKEKNKSFEKRLAKLEEQNKRRTAGLNWPITAGLIALVIGGGFIWKYQEKRAK